MTDDNFFFRWIWRLNGLALFGILGFVVLVAGSQFLGLPPPDLRPMEVLPGAAPQASGAEQARGAAKLRLFLDYARPGREEVVFALAPPHPSEYYKSAYGAGDPDTALGVSFADMRRVANYVFIDAATGNARWLFPTNNQTILNTDYMSPEVTGQIGPDGLPVSSAGTKAPVVLYDVQPATSAGATPAKFEVYAAKLDGTKLTKLLDDLDEIPVETIQGDKVQAHYVSKGRRMLAVFSAGEFKLLFKKDITDLAPGSP